MARNFFKIFEGLTLNPRTVDPTTPGEGDVQFSDGTARAKGLWQYFDGAWQTIGGSGFTVESVSSNINLEDGKIYLVDSTVFRILTLPAPSSGARIVVKDASGLSSANAIQVAPNSTETIDGIALYQLTSAYESKQFVSDGTNWFII